MDATRTGTVVSTSAELSSGYREITRLPVVQTQGYGVAVGPRLDGALLRQRRVVEDGAEPAHRVPRASGHHALDDVVGVLRQANRRRVDIPEQRAQGRGSPRAEEPPATSTAGVPPSVLPSGAFTTSPLSVQ